MRVVGGAEKRPIGEIGVGFVDVDGRRSRLDGRRPIAVGCRSLTICGLPQCIDNHDVDVGEIGFAGVLSAVPVGVDENVTGDIGVADDRNLDQIGVARRDSSEVTVAWLLTTGPPSWINQ